MNRKSTKRMVALLGLVGLLVTSSWGFEGRPGGEGGRRPSGPPPEAIAACEGKSEGAVVEFTSPRGDKVSATCRSLDGQLVAAPAGKGPRGGTGGPRDDSSQ